MSCAMRRLSAVFEQVYVVFPRMRVRAVATVERDEGWPTP